MEDARKLDILCVGDVSSGLVQLLEKEGFKHTTENLMRSSSGNVNLAYGVSYANRKNLIPITKEEYNNLKSNSQDVIERTAVIIKGTPDEFYRAVEIVGNYIRSVSNVITFKN